MIKIKNFFKVDHSAENKNVMFLCNHATYFHSHRLEIAQKLIELGSNVSLFCGSKVTDESFVCSNLQNEQIQLLRQTHYSGSTNIMSVLWFVLKFFIMMRKVKPSLLHCISMKAVIIGLMYSKFFPKTNTVIAISGLGSIFTDDNRPNLREKSQSLLVFTLLRYLTYQQKNIKYIVQNNDDYLFLTSSLSIPTNNINIISGSGVEIRNYSKMAKSIKSKKVLMASRLLKNKGVIEYLASTKKLKKKYPDWEFLLAGSNDFDSPASFDENNLVELLAGSNCKYLGYVEDMSKLLEDIAIFVLPSYREGFPKALMEAGVAGCAIVTTNVQGCRDAILNGRLGVMIEPRSVEEVERGVSALIDCSEDRVVLSEAMEKYSREQYSVQKVVAKHLEIYESFFA